MIYRRSYANCVIPMPAFDSAVKSIGMMGSAARQVAPLLAAALGDEDADVRRAAVAALRRVTPDARPSDAEISAIAADLRDPDSANRLRALKTLANMGPAAASASAAIEAVADDRDPDVKKLAQDLLNKLAAANPPAAPPPPATIPSQSPPVIVPMPYGAMPYAPVTAPMPQPN